jgi:hypothetical protein
MNSTTPVFHHKTGEQHLSGEVHNVHVRRWEKERRTKVQRGNYSLCLLMKTNTRTKQQNTIKETVLNGEIKHRTENKHHNSKVKPGYLSMVLNQG